MKKSSGRRESTLWVNCPGCGNKVFKAKFGSVFYHCRCGVEFTACIGNGGVTTLMNNEDSSDSLTEQLDRYRQQLSY